MPKMYVLLAMASGCLAPTSSIGTSPTPTTTDSAADSAEHSAYVVPELPPPTPGRLELPTGAEVRDYVLGLVVAGPGEWDAHVRGLAGGGCWELPCDEPLPDAATLGIDETSSWLALAPPVNDDYLIDSVTITEAGAIVVEFHLCSTGDDGLWDGPRGQVHRIPRAAYTGVELVNTFQNEDSCVP
jgi:hypothetical protein